MRKSFYSIFFVLLISSAISPVFPALLIPHNHLDETGGINNLNSSASTEINTTISINDYPGSPTNWTWAKDQGYCTGSGTLSDPYVISDIFFNTSSITWNCLTIANSRKHFVVRDCEFKGTTQYAGVQLDNTTNGVISENFMHPLTGALVWVFNASHNTIRNNNASDAFFYGVLLDGSGGLTEMNTVTDNLMKYNDGAGIQFRGLCDLNIISDNVIYNNTIGVEMGPFANNNSISGNHIGNSTLFGVFINILSQYNELYENCFMGNNIHADDSGLNNTWDTGVRGNYWDNYTGLDADNNGIGDAPYNITGVSGSQDNYPLMSCPVPSSPPGIPGYDVLFVLYIGATSIIGIIFFIKKKLKS